MRILSLMVPVFLGTAFSTAGQESLELRGTGWVNSKEMSLERLKGKVVALYFFEEG